MHEPPPPPAVAIDVDNSIVAKAKRTPKPKRQRKPGAPNRAMRRAIEKAVRCMKRGTQIPKGVMQRATPNHLLVAAVGQGFMLELVTRRDRAQGRDRYGIFARPLSPEDAHNMLQGA